MTNTFALQCVMCSLWIDMNKIKVTDLLYAWFTSLLLLPFHYLIKIADNVKTHRTRRPQTRGRRHSSHSRQPQRSWRRRKALYVHNAIALTAAVNTPRHATFDTNPCLIGIDNRASACISYQEDDFKQGTLVKTSRVIKGYGGTRSDPLKRGTLLWDWYDDNGRLHSFEIPNSFCDPSGGLRLLSPQHFAQAIGQPESAGKNTNGRTCTLYWDGGRHRMTIPLDRSNNVATFATTPSLSRYDKFCERAEITRQDDDDPITSMTARSVIEDNLESITTSTSPAPTPCNPCVFDSTINRPSNVTSWTSLNDTYTKDEAELLQHHHNLQHIPFSRLREMAKQGTIPRRLANCRTPVCAACMYGRATRKKWKNKPSNDSNIISPTKGDQPGNLVLKAVRFEIL